MKKNNYLYEEMMQDIAVIVKHRINEAYDNQLLEEYGAKDIFNDVMKEATKDGKIFYTHLKKFIIYVISYSTLILKPFRSTLLSFPFSSLS